MFFIICGIIVPILFVVYNIVYYLKKKVIYTIRNDNFVIINNNYFKVQLLLSCINSIFISIIVRIWDKLKSPMYFLLFLLIYWGINYLIKFIAILKKYAKIEK